MNDFIYMCALNVCVHIIIEYIFFKLKFYTKCLNPTTTPTYICTHTFRIKYLNPEGLQYVAPECWVSHNISVACPARHGACELMGSRGTLDSRWRCSKPFVEKRSSALNKDRRPRKLQPGVHCLFPQAFSAVTLSCH